MAPRAYNAAQQEWGPADTFNLAAGTASKTYDGFRRKAREDRSDKQVGALRAQQLKNAQATEQATMARLQDLAQERAVRQARADAQIANLQWRFRQMQGGNDAITSASRGEGAGVGKFEGNYQDLERLIPELQNLPPAQREAALGFAQTRIQGMIQEQRYNEAVREIQDGIEDGILTPESGQEMLAGLDDATFTEASPDAILKVIREQRNAFADKQAAFQLKDLTVQNLQGMILDPSSQANYGASDEEWSRRQAQALRLAARYEQFWKQVKPEDAKKQIKAVLSGQGPESEEKRWERAYDDAKGEPAFRELQTEEEQMEYIRKQFRLRGGDIERGGAQGPLTGLGGPGEDRQAYRSFQELPPQAANAFDEAMLNVYREAVSGDQSASQRAQAMQGVMDEYGVNMTQEQNKWFLSRAQQMEDEAAEPGFIEKAGGYLGRLMTGADVESRGDRARRMARGSRGAQVGPVKWTTTPAPSPQQAAQGVPPGAAPQGKWKERASALGYEGAQNPKAFKAWVDKSWKDGLKPETWFEEVRAMLSELESK